MYVSHVTDKSCIWRFKPRPSRQCFDESQRQHLLGVIESSFGSFDVFNSIVRHSFANKLEELLVDTAHSAAATRHGTKKGAALRPSGRQLTQKV